MAGFDYGKIQGIASDVMAKFKQGVIKLVIVTPGTGPAYDPGEPTETSYTLDATVSGVPMRYIQGGLAVEGDLLVVAAVHATAPEPKPGNKITVDGIPYRVIAPIPVPAAGDKIVWKFIVRR